MTIRLSQSSFQPQATSALSLTGKAKQEQWNIVTIVFGKANIFGTRDGRRKHGILPSARRAKAKALVIHDAERRQKF